MAGATHRSRRDLVLFTTRFPYDGSEGVIRHELEATARRFRRVLIVPSQVGERPCALPPNAVVVDVGLRGSWDRAAKVRALKCPMAARVLGATLRHPRNLKHYAVGARSYLDILATSLLKANRLEAWVRAERLGDALFYDYWFENTTLPIAVLRRAGVIGCAVARAHGFDVYDFRWENLGRVPFREFKAANLDAIFAVSEHGAHYLKRRLGPHAEKVRVSRLGVPLSPPPRQLPVEPPLVVSCSALRPGKKVHRIPEVLASCDRPLRWVHFGDGPERSRVEAAASRLPPRVQYELAGAVPNADILDYYRRHHVAAFLSVSVSEGIPVSMMEAQSCGIPIVALAVGGVPEIVTPGAGVLVSPDAAVSELGRALEGALRPGRFQPAVVHRSFAARFEASTNFGDFARELSGTCVAARDHGLA